MTVHEQWASLLAVAESAARIRRLPPFLMHRLTLASVALLGLVAAATPVQAKVLADGKPSPGGFYWQKVEKGDKSIQYVCRSNKETGIQKNAQCNGAKAVKP